MTKKLLGRLELQVIRDSETQQRKIVFRNQNGELIDPADNPELMATLVAGGVTQADLNAALATKANASSLAAKADTTAVTAAISAQHTVDNGTYATVSSAKSTITYNADGSVATVTETATGAVTTYTYNADGTPATESRVLGGVTTTRTFAYTGGNLTGVS